MDAHTRERVELVPVKINHTAILFQVFDFLISTQISKLQARYAWKFAQEETHVGNKF